MRPGNKYFFLAGFVSLTALLWCAPVKAQEETGYHPWLSDRFHVAVGPFARQQGFNIRADGQGPEEEIDFDEELGVDDDDIGAQLTFRWRFGSKWSVWGQSWDVDSTGGAQLDEDIEFEDFVFKKGSFVEAGVENTVVRVFFGRKITEGARHEFGLGAGFHWLEIKAFILGEALTSEGDFEFTRADVSADSPLPNIGGWFYYSPSSRWLIEARLDWLDASVGDYSGGIWNSSVGVNFQAFRNVGLGLHYQYFTIDLDVDKSDWRGGAEVRYRGPFLSLTGSW